MKIPTRKEIVIDIVWLVFRCITSLILFLVLSPLFLALGVFSLIFYVALFIASVIDDVLERIYFFKGYPIDYLKIAIKSIKVLMRYEEWKCEREK